MSLFSGSNWGLTCLHQLPQDPRTDSISLVNRPQSRILLFTELICEKSTTAALTVCVLRQQQACLDLHRLHLLRAPTRTSDWDPGGVGPQSVTTDRPEDASAGPG